MLRLFKKAAAAKNIPLLALALFAAVFVGNLVYASVIGQTSDQWLYDPLCGSPENSSCYDQYGTPTGNLSDDCLQEENEVCGIIADEDGTTGKPLIDPESDLFQDLQNGNYADNDSIFRMPYVEP